MTNAQKRKRDNVTQISANWSRKEASRKMELKSFFLRVLPIACCIWQLYYISEGYFAYSTVNEITQLKENSFQPPVFVFCVTAIESYSNTTALIGNPCGAQVTRQDFPTPGSLLGRFDAPRDAIFGFKNRQGESEAISRDYILQKFYSSYFMCHSVMHKEKGFSLPNNITSEPIYLEFRTKPEWYFGDRVEFAFYPQRVAPFFTHKIFEDDACPFLPKHDGAGRNCKARRVSYAVGYEETQFQLLPSPYVTDCFDYASHGVGSKDYCGKKCLNERSMRENATLYGSSFIPPGSELENAKFVDEEPNFEKDFTICEKV